MALSRLRSVAELNKFCNAKSHMLLQNPPNSFIKFQRVRHFKKLKPVECKEAQPTPFQNASFDNHSFSIGNLWKPFAFTIAFSSASFGCATIWQYENMRSHAIKMMKQPIGWLQKKAGVAQQKAGTWRREANELWNKLSSGEKVFVPICVLNLIVFGLWRIPSMQPTMMKYFCSNPASKAVCWPMILSTFSHYSAFHIFANMYVLHSFSSGAVASLGKEQFLALYLSAGVISSFSSYLYKAVTLQPGLSLGASGAIMAILGYVCTQFPDTKLGIIFLPMFTFSAGAAIKAIVAMDFAGVVLGWKFFDHAAHLGGAACGIAWAYWGNEYIWQKRDPLLQYWHTLRGGSIK